MLICSGVNCPGGCIVLEKGENVCLGQGICLTPALGVLFLFEPCMLCVIYVWPLCSVSYLLLTTVLSVLLTLDYFSLCHTLVRPLCFECFILLTPAPCALHTPIPYALCTTDSWLQNSVPYILLPNPLCVLHSPDPSTLCYTLLCSGHYIPLIPALFKLYSTVYAPDHKVHCLNSCLLIRSP